MSEIIEIVIPEPIQAYVRMTQRSKFINPYARAYMVNQQTLKWYMNQAMCCGEFNIIDHQPMGCDMNFNLTQIHKADLDNLVKAVLDAATGIVFSNDAWIDSLSARRKLARQPELIFQVWTLEK